MSKGGPRSSSSVRTPLSVRPMSLNRSTGKSKEAMTPKRFQSTAKKSNAHGLESSARRVSTMGPARGWKESRPLTDKSWQRDQIRRLLDFLRENRFKNDSMTSKNFPLNGKEFSDVFNFLYSFLNPHKPEILPQCKFEEKFIHILKNELNYPGQISKTHMMTFGTLHTWPTHLGCLHFIFEMVKRKKFYEDNAVVFAFPSMDEKGFAIDRENKNKIHLSHCIKAYIMFMANDDDKVKDAVDEKYRISMMEYYDVNPSLISQLQDRRNKEVKELEELKEIESKAKTVEAKVKEKTKSVTDLETRLKQGSSRCHKFKDMVEKIQEINHNNAQLLTEMIEKVPFSLPSTETALEKMAEDLATYCNQLNQQLETSKKNKADAEAEAYHRAHEIQTVIRRLNRYCANQEWDINIPVPEVKKGVLSANPDLPYILERFKHYQESYKKEISDLQNKIQERKLNLVNLKSKKEVHEVGLAKLRQREKEILEQNQLEEGSLHTKLKDMKQQLFLRSNKNQEAKEDLMREVEELREKHERLLTEKVSVKEDIKSYQEQAVNMVKNTMAHVLLTREEAKKAVDQRDEKYQLRQREALQELKKLEDSIKNMEG